MGERQAPWPVLLGSRANGPFEVAEQQSSVSLRAVLRLAVPQGPPAALLRVSGFHFEQ